MWWKLYWKGDLGDALSCCKWPMCGMYTIIKHSEKSLARSMLFYSRNVRKQNSVQFVLCINNDCMHIDNCLHLWLKNCCKNTEYYSIFHISLLLLLNNCQYNCNNTISSVSVQCRLCISKHLVIEETTI